MTNIQDEVMKIHHKYGTTEMANYQIQLLFDREQKELKGLLRECYNVLTDSTGLDEPKDKPESSLCRRVRLAINP